MWRFSVRATNCQFNESLWLVGGVTEVGSFLTEIYRVSEKREANLFYCSPFCHAMLCISAAYAIMRCLSISPSVTFVYSVEMNKCIFKIFSPSGSHTILVFPHQVLWQYSNGDPPKGCVECRWGMQKSRFLTNIWLHHVLSTVQPPMCYTHSCTRQWQVSVTISGVICCSQETDDKVFMTGSLSVTLNTTEQNFSCTQW